MGYWKSNEYLAPTKSPNQQDLDGGWKKSKGVAVDEIIGLPPQAYQKFSTGDISVDDMVNKLSRASLGMLEIIPCVAKFGGSDAKTGEPATGLQIFTLEEAKDKYKKILTVCGFNVENMSFPLRIVHMGDLQVSDSWSNAYNEGSFEGLVNVGSDKLLELRQMTGADDLTGALDKLSNTFSGNDGGMNQVAGMLLGGLAGGAAAMEGVITSIAGDKGAAKLLSGSKVDFPKIWNASSFDPSYDFTIRLYNPQPNDPKSYESRILLPLAKLLALAIPTSDSKYTYDFPLMLKIRCPGLFKLPAAYVQSINLIKGGDINDISYHQQPGTVDVRLSVGSLYSTMVANIEEDAEDESGEERPTLKKYFDNMKDYMDYENWNSSSGQPGSENEGEGSDNYDGETDAGMDTNEKMGSDSETFSKTDRSQTPGVDDNEWTVLSSEDRQLSTDPYYGTKDGYISKSSSTFGNSPADAFSGDGGWDVISKQDRYLGDIQPISQLATKYDFVNFGGDLAATSWVGSAVDLSKNVSAITGKLDSVASMAGSIVSGPMNAISSGLGSVSGAMGGITNTISSVAGNAGNVISEIAGPISGGLDAITGGATNAFDFTFNALDNSIKKYDSVVNSVSNIQSSISSQASAISNVKDSLSGQINSVTGTTVNRLRNDVVVDEVNLVEIFDNIDGSSLLDSIDTSTAKTRIEGFTTAVSSVATNTIGAIDNANSLAGIFNAL